MSFTYATSVLKFLLCGSSAFLPRNKNINKNKTNKEDERAGDLSHDY